MGSDHNDFQEGLCGCFDDCNICLCSFCCPCIQFGRNWGNMSGVYEVCQHLRVFHLNSTLAYPLCEQAEEPHCVFLSKGATQEDTCQKAIWGCLLFYCFDVGISMAWPTCGLFTAFYLYKWRDHLRKGLDYRVRPLSSSRFALPSPSYCLFSSIHPSFQPNLVPDFFLVWCCTPCVIAQEGREIKAHLLQKGVAPLYS
jgi:Cys-rich protein (TIGR01571 family)